MMLLHVCLKAKIQQERFKVKLLASSNSLSSVLAWFQFKGGGFIIILHIFFFLTLDDQMPPCLYIPNRIILAFTNSITIVILCSYIFLNKGFYLFDLLYLDNWAKKRNYHGIILKFTFRK